MFSRVYVRHFKNPLVIFSNRFNLHNTTASSPSTYLSNKNDNNLKHKTTTNDCTSLVNRRFPTISQNNVKVTNIGATSQIGQPLALYSKYQVTRRPGAEVDNSHVNTSVRVTGHNIGDRGLCKALRGLYTYNKGSSPCFYLSNKDIITLKQTNNCTSVIKRNFSTTSQNNFKVAIVGAAGGIGQALAIYLKHHSLITHLALYDISKITPGVAVDLSHISTCVRVTGHTGEHGLCEALCGANLVICSAGVPRKPGMSREDLFKVNADVIIHISQTLACFSPCAFFAIITNPVNSMVPLAAEILTRMGVYDSRKLCGVTTLDIVRAQTFIGQINCCDPAKVEVPVIGGHAGKTIIPVLSQAKPNVCLKLQDDLEWLTKKIQNAGTEVVKAKDGGGSATLSMAYAASKFVSSVLKGLTGISCVECAYVNSGVTEATFFSTPVVLGKCGIEVNLGYGCLNSYEHKQVDEAIPELKKKIYEAVDYVNSKDIKPPKYFIPKCDDDTKEKS